MFLSFSLRVLCALHHIAGDKLQVVKERLSLIVGVDEDDVRLFELLTPDRRLSLATQQQSDKLKAAAKQKGSNNPYAANTNTASSTAAAGQSQSREAALADYVQPPLDCERKVSECGLDNDAIVLFCYRVGEADEWEEMEAAGVVERKGTSSRRHEEKAEG